MLKYSDLENFMYESNYEEILYNKIIENDYEIEDKLAECIVYNCSIQNYYGDNRRWTRTVTSIVEINNHFFEIEWEEGLTEMQDDFFFETKLIEVERKEEIVTHTVIKWVKKERNNLM